MIRVVSSLLVSIGFACAFADRVVTIPSAYAIQEGEAKAELIAFGEGLKFGWMRLDSRVLPFVELQVYGSKMPNETTKFSFNLQYTLIQPFPDATPAICVGLLDALNETEFGRSMYVAVTFVSNIYSDWADREQISLTIGGGIGGIRRGAFVGVNLPVLKHVAFVGEYDTKRITAGLDIEALPNVGVRVLFRGGEPMIGLQFRRLF